MGAGSKGLARPTDKPKNGLVPKTGVDPLKSFDLDRFSPTKFAAFFSVVFRASRGGGEMEPEEGPWNVSGVKIGNRIRLSVSGPGPPENK